MVDKAFVLNYAIDVNLMKVFLHEEKRWLSFNIFLIHPRYNYYHGDESLVPAKDVLDY